jgi:hypothetical protein
VGGGAFFVAGDGAEVSGGEAVGRVLEEIDFVAAYIIPLDLWYIIPAAVVAKRKGSIWLSPWRRQNKYERYLEAWHLLQRWREGKYSKKAGRKQRRAGEERRCPELAHP